MELLVLIVHIFTAVSIVALVLIQHGKGADVGAAFGSGSAGSVFGSSGSANFMSRATAILALVFFLSSMGLTWLSTKKSGHKGVMATQPPATQSAPDQIPATPVPPAGKADGGAQKSVPAAVPAAPADAGSKSQEVPK